LYVENNSLKKLKEEDQKYFINMALDVMDTDESLILTLFYQLGNSVDEISKILDISKSNVKVKLFRSRKKFKIVLENILKNEVYCIL